MDREFRIGDMVLHFKGKEYTIIAIGVYTETGDKMIVYQAVYGDRQVYIRPYDSFISEVDHDKYPNVTQKYRFEIVEEC